MNILMLTNTFTPHVGGVANSVQAFTAEYRRLGHRVLVITPTFEGMPVDEEDVIRIPAIQRFNGSDFSVPMPVPGFLTPALDEFQPDIVHSHHPFLLGDTALRIAASRDIPVVFTHHTQFEQYTHYVPGDSPALQRFVVDLTTGYCRLCDSVIVPSESIASIVCGQGVETRIEVIPTGVDVRRFAEGDGHAFRAALNIPAGAFVVGHLGRLAPEKNLGFLAEAVAGFIARHQNACFLVAGSGPSEQDIKQIFATRRLSDRLYLAGKVQGRQQVDAYHAMDVFAFASQSETQGMVLTEAIAAGVPVVAVDAAGAREVVIDGQNGRLLPREDSAEFAAALEWIASLSDEQRQVMRRAMAETAERFSLGRCAARALSLYQLLTSSARAAKQIDSSPWAKSLRLMEGEWKILVNRARAAGVALRGREKSQDPSER